jgi:hypothetical protein
LKEPTAVSSENTLYDLFGCGWSTAALLKFAARGRDCFDEFRAPTIRDPASQNFHK